VQAQSGGGSGGKDGARNAAAASGSGGGVAELLESTLWSRQLGSLSEQLVAALVCQIFEGTRAFISSEQTHCLLFVSPFSYPKNFVRGRKWQRWWARSSRVRRLLNT